MTWIINHQPERIYRTMGITRITALEIFTNPGDLEFTIGQDKDSSKFAIGIFRGPGHRYKPMITSVPFAETQEDAVKAVEEILQMIHDCITKEFENPGSIASQYLNPDGREIDQSKVLSQDLISRILGELQQHQKASTCDMVVIAS